MKTEKVPLDDQGSLIAVDPAPAVLSFIPAKLMKDPRGMRRSVVHYINPDHPDTLQIIQTGVETTEHGYTSGPFVKDHEVFHFMLAGREIVTIDRQSFEVKAGQIVYTPRSSNSVFASDETSPRKYVWMVNALSASEMAIATLNYSETNIVAYLHQFTLLRILDCRKEDVYRYQLMVNPEENPECFENAA